MADRTVLLVLVLACALASGAVRADDDACDGGVWEVRTLSGDSGVGGTGARGDEGSGVGGTGARGSAQKQARGDDSGLGGTGARGDESGIGGTGIFGTVTAADALCVNGQRVALAPYVQVIREKGLAVGAENLFAGETVWFVSGGGGAGGKIGRVWVLSRAAGEEARRAWLEARIAAAPGLAALSIETRGDRFSGGELLDLGGVQVDARSTAALRSVVRPSDRVRVSGRLTRDGLLRAERLAIQVRPPVRPQRPVDRPPRIERPTDRKTTPVRPDIRIVPQRPNDVR